jgi:hypothetical protein
MIITYEHKGRVQEIEFDAVITAAHQSGSIVTEHPIEKGSPVNDHIHKQADRLSVEAMVSNTPIVVPSTQMRGVNGSVQSTGVEYEQIDRAISAISFRTPRTASVNVLRFDGVFDRVRDVYTELKLIEENGLTVGVRTVYRGGLRDYTDMAIVGLTVPVDSASGTAKTFHFDLQKMTIVETKKVPASASHRETKKKGHKPKKEEKKADAPKRESILAAAKDKAAAAYKAAKSAAGL